MKTLIAFAFLLFLFASACAPGLDGARQAEANVNATIGAGFRACKAYVHTKTEADVAIAQAGKDAEAQIALDLTAKVGRTCLQVLDTASVAADAQHQAIVVAEAAGSKDAGGIIAVLVQIGADVLRALKDNGINLQGVQ